MLLAVDSFEILFCLCVDPDLLSLLDEAWNPDLESCLEYGVLSNTLDCIASCSILSLCYNIYDL